MVDVIIILVIGVVIGAIIGRYFESGRTQRIQHKLIHEKRDADKKYQEEVKALEKSLKNLKGKLDM